MDYNTIPSTPGDATRTYYSPNVMPPCPHALKHTERLWKERPVPFHELKESVDGVNSFTYVIETYCADCGSFLKQVEIKP